jgi:hypothetical protein
MSLELAEMRSVEAPIPIVPLEIWEMFKLRFLVCKREMSIPELEMSISGLEMSHFRFENVLLKCGKYHGSGLNVGTEGG